MSTDQDYETIADRVYYVDPLWAKGSPLLKGSKISMPGGSDSGVIEVSDPDPQSGFQAMAVAPLLPDGSLDKNPSHVVIAFAGTNPADSADVVADAQSVVAGKTGPGSQVAKAQAFAAEITKEYPAASITVTGHSLGGLLALDVAAENHWPATTFNGPDPWGVLSPQAKAWLKAQEAAGQRPLTNFVDQYDVIGNFAGNGTGAAVYVKDEPGKKNPLDYHNLSAFHFAKDGSGSVLGTGAERMSTWEIAWNVTSFIPDLVTRTEITQDFAGLLSLEKNDPDVSRGTASFVTGLAVLVNTVGAADLARRVGDLTADLSAIKAVNDGLVDAMTAALNTAKGSAFELHPFVSETDIENCVRQHQLEVRENIDESAVAAVDALVDDHKRTVTQIVEGLMRTIANSESQDAQWSAVLGGQ